MREFGGRSPVVELGPTCSIRPQDEYSDPSSLENRLQKVARHMVQNSNGQATSRSNGSVNGGAIESRHPSLSGASAPAQAMTTRSGMASAHASGMFTSPVGMENAPAGPGLDFNQSGGPAPVMIPVNHNGMPPAQPVAANRGVVNMMPTASLLDDSGSMLASGSARGPMFEAQMGNGAPVVRGTVPSTWDTNMIPVRSLRPLRCPGRARFAQGCRPKRADVRQPRAPPACPLCYQ